MRKLKVLVVGQTPPPYGGQAIMIQKVLEGHYDMVDLYHVRMAFSHTMSEMGKFKFYKLHEQIKVVIKILRLSFQHRFDVLFYPPAANNRWSLTRDITTLIAIRWMFPKVVFMFQAGGLSTIYNHSPLWLKFLMKLAYFRPDIAVHVSHLLTDDGRTIHARKILVVHNTTEDVYPLYSAHRSMNEVPVILFVGALFTSKGIFDLLDACSILKSRGIDFQLKVMGEGDQEMAIRDYISQNRLKDNVTLLGVKTNGEKWEEFARADIFCFPTYFEAETFGIVVLEAMMFSLPVVATRWRGLPELVRDGENGFLVPIKHPHLLADKLQLLIENPILRTEMGKYGRKLFLSNFAIDKFYKKMGEMWDLLR